MSDTAQDRREGTRPKGAALDLFFRQSHDEQQSASLGRFVRLILSREVERIVSEINLESEREM